MTAYFNTPELTAIRKAVEDLDKQEDDLEDKLKQRELAIATQLAGGAQPATAAAQYTLVIPTFVAAAVLVLALQLVLLG